MGARVRMLPPLGAALLAAAAFAAVDVDTIDGFHRIDERVALAGQPTLEQVSALKGAGFRALVNLREETETDAGPEKLAATDAGLVYLNVPFSAKSPSDRSVDEFLRVTDDASIYPVVIHCVTGNRAAALWMVRRVLRDGWALAKAEAEAEGAGLRTAAMKDFALDYIRGHAPHKEGTP